MKLSKDYLNEREFWERLGGFGGDKNGFLYFLAELQIDDYQNLLAKFSAVNQNSVAVEIGPGVMGVAGSIFDSPLMVDFSYKLLRNNRNNGMPASKKNAYICASSDAIPIKSGSVDVVICNDVLHHFKAESVLEESLKEIRDILKPGGLFIVIDRNPHSIMQDLVLIPTMLTKKLLMKFMFFQTHGSLNEPTFKAMDYALIYKYFNNVVLPVFRYDIFLFTLASLYALANVMLPRFFPDTILKFCRWCKRLFQAKKSAHFHLEMMSVLQSKGGINVY